MLNKVFVMGRLVRDPELRRTQSGIPVTTMRLAVERDFKSQDGTKQTDFFDVVAWRHTAEFVTRWFTRGRLAIVEGRLQTRDWTDRDGNRRVSVEIVADNVYFGTSRRDEGGDYAPYSGAPGYGGFGAPGSGGYYGNTGGAPGYYAPSYGGAPGYDNAPGNAPGYGGAPGYDGVSASAPGYGGTPGYDSVSGNGPSYGGAPGYDNAPGNAPGYGGAPGYDSASGNAPGYSGASGHDNASSYEESPSPYIAPSSSPDSAPGSDSFAEIDEANDDDLPF